jgi:hypothetical protein
VVRKATACDAQAVHDIMSTIPWISDATKSTEGYGKTKEACIRGTVYVLTVRSTIASMMIFQKDNLAASCGYNIWRIPLIATIETEQRKGYARRLVRKAKQVASHAAICAYAENDKSAALLKSERFIRVRGKTDTSGHPLYEWRPRRKQSETAKGRS